MALQLLALVGYAAFLAVTFGLPTLRARSAGRSSWRRPVSGPDAVGETTCAVACLLTLAAPALAAAGLVRSAAVGWPVARGLAAAVALGAGTALALSAQRHLAGEWRAGVEASGTLVTSGPFAVVRNPFYLGCFLAAAAVLVAVPSVAALAGLVLHVVAAEIIVRAVEEPVLRDALGDDFARYARRTGRFLPHLPTARRSRGGASS